MKSFIFLLLLIPATFIFYGEYQSISHSCTGWITSTQVHQIPPVITSGQKLVTATIVPFLTLLASLLLLLTGYHTITFITRFFRSIPISLYAIFLMLILFPLSLCYIIHPIAKRFLRENLHYHKDLYNQIVDNPSILFWIITATFLIISGKILYRRVITLLFNQSNESLPTHRPRRNAQTDSSHPHLSRKDILSLAKMMIGTVIVILVITMFFGDNIRDMGSRSAKPVIYLYPQQKTDISVELNYRGKLVATYPDYNRNIKGWKVTASPDSTLINHADNQEYSYLFWEGDPETPVKWDLSTGFIVKGSDTRQFLQKTLKKMGLTPKEYNEFIVYWYPLMMNNQYNLIHFAEKQYLDTAPLKITPKPDSLLRVFMVVKPLQKPISIKKQILKPFKRHGFSVVEWGGTLLR